MNLKPNPDALADLFLRLPTRTHTPSIVEYAATTIVPTGKYRGLKFEHSKAPYLTEIMECLSPASPFREVAIMFPAQSGKTFTADTMAMYYIEAVPSEIVYATSNETMAKKWLEREIEPRAAHSGIVFKTEVETKSQRKTGDTSISKIFPGGNLDAVTANSAGQLASATKRIVLADEVDRWKIKLGEQGSTLNQLRARTQAWGNQAKIFWFSTPTTEDASVIFVIYQQGDQRQYYVPCPYCGTMQLLDFFEGRGYGLHWEHRSGHIYKKSIELICENKNCGRGIRESSKPGMLLGGQWRASAIPEYEHICSFHINGLYSFQLKWYDIVVAYEEGQKSELAKQDFDQLKMGRPHKQKGSKIRADKIIENRGTYKSGTVPDGVLFLTAGVDVQEGSKKDPANPPRLEMEILGIGSQWRTWSICYEVFKGEIDDPYAGAWEEMTQWFIEKHGGGKFYRNDGFEFPLRFMLVDSGDGKMSDVVYDFCSRPEWVNTFPSKGMPDIRMGKKDGPRPDEIIQGNRLPWRRSVLDNDILLYLINTNYYKHKIFNYFNVERTESPIQRFGYCEFPADYSDWYFQMFASEEKRRDGSFHNPTGRRNEALDCRVMAMCAGDIWLSDEVTQWREWAKSMKLPQQAIYKKYNRNYVLDLIAKQTLRKSA